MASPKLLKRFAYGEFSIVALSYTGVDQYRRNYSKQSSKRAARVTFFCFYALVDKY